MAICDWRRVQIVITIGQGVVLILVFRLDIDIALGFIFERRRGSNLVVCAICGRERLVWRRDVGHDGDWDLARDNRPDLSEILICRIKNNVYRFLTSRQKLVQNFSIIRLMRRWWWREMRANVATPAKLLTCKGCLNLVSNDFAPAIWSCPERKLLWRVARPVGVGIFTWVTFFLAAFWPAFAGIWCCWCWLGG